MSWICANRLRQRIVATAHRDENAKHFSHSIYEDVWALFKPLQCVRIHWSAYNSCCIDRNSKRHNQKRKCFFSYLKTKIKTCISLSGSFEVDKLFSFRIFIFNWIFSIHVYRHQILYLNEYVMCLCVFCAFRLI